MIKRLFSGLSALLLSLSSLFVLAPMIAHAATDTCTWDGSSSATWNTAANWTCSTDGEAVPEAGDSLVFPYGASVTNKTLTNDLSGGTSFATITFSGTKGSEEDYVLGGNAIALTTGITNSSTGAYGITINLAITASSNLAISTSNTLNFGSSSVTDKTIALGSTTTTATGGGGLLFYGPVTGSGNITTANGIGFYGIATGYTGQITMTDSAFQISQEDGFGGSIVLEGDAYLLATICDGQTLTTNITVNSVATEFSSQLNLYSSICSDSGGGGGGGGGGCDPATAFVPCDVTPNEYVSAGSIPTTGSITLAGNLTLGADAQLFSTAKNTKITSALSGDHALSLTAGGNTTLSLEAGSNSSKTANGVINPSRKETTIAAGNESAAIVSVSGYAKYIVNGKRGDVYATEGALVGGTGTVGKLKIDDDAFVGPGNSPGCLNTGDLTEGGTYLAEIAGTEACTGYDQIKVTGTVNVTNGVLDISFLNNFKGKAKDSFTLIANDGGDAVTGTFKDLAEGATFKSASGHVLKVSYKGGDGNDVVLSIVSIPGAPDTGFGMLFNNPAALLATTTAAAFGILLISRRLAPKKVRR